MKRVFFIKFLTVVLLTCFSLFCLSSCMTQTCEHEWTIRRVVPPTCLEDGIKRYVCVKCSETKLENIDKTGHDFVVHDGKTPTCLEMGWEEYKTCNNCDYSNYKDLPKAHNYSEGACLTCGEKQASENLDFWFDSIEKTYTLKGLGKCTDSDVVIPSLYNGYPVTEIGGNILPSNDTAMSITIPSSITKISDYAFSNYTALQRLTFSCVAEFGNNCFLFCDNLQIVNYVGSLENLMRNTFEGNFAYSSPTACSKDIYLNGELVTEVVVPESITEISSIFTHCKSITKVTIHDKVTKINNAFVGCPLECEIKDGLKYIGNENNKYMYLVGIVDKKVESVTIDENCKFISAGVLSRCSNIKEIYIPENVLSISDGAFIENPSLTQVAFAEDSKVKYIGIQAFSLCKSMERLNIPITVTEIGESAFANFPISAQIYYEGTVKMMTELSRGKVFGGSFDTLNEIYCMDGVFIMNR